MTRVAQTPQVETVAEMYGAIQAGDLEEALERVHPEIVVHEADSIPFYGGVHSGREAFVGTLAGPMFEHLELEIHDVTVRDAGDVVMAALDLTFTSKATGKSIRMPIIEVSTVTDGLVKHMDIYYKDAAAMAATFPEGVSG